MKSNRSDEFADAIERARPRLGRLASPILFCETIGSTNDEAARSVGSSRRARTDDDASDATNESTRRAQAPAERCEGLVVVADEQTAGRGRRGHTWFSPPGSGLYVSVVLAPATRDADPARATTLLTLAAGVALAEGIEQATGLRVDLKWPNDLQVARRKLGGILAEASGAGDRSDTVVVGYGINVRPTAFPPELRRSRDVARSRSSDAPSIAITCSPKRSPRCRAATRICSPAGSMLSSTRGAASRRPRPARGSDGRPTPATWSGVTAGIDDRGALLVRTGDRIERIVSGEVTWL